MISKTLGCVSALIALTASAAAGPLPAGALDGAAEGWFYNRPGAKLAQSVSDLLPAIAAMRRGL